MDYSLKLVRYDDVTFECTLSLEIFFFYQIIFSGIPWLKKFISSQSLIVICSFMAGLLCLSDNKINDILMLE